MSKFITVLKQLNETLNPFYRNAIVTLPDAEHLNVDRLDPGAPHLAAYRISKLLLANENVHSAIRCLQGDHYLLRSVLTYNELRVNVYEILPSQMRVDDEIASHSFLTGEPIKLMPFVASGNVHHVLKRVRDERWELQGQVASAQTVRGFYEPDYPAASWIIPMEPSDHRILGFR